MSARRRFGATLMMIGTLIMVVSLAFAVVVYAQPRLVGLSTVTNGATVAVKAVDGARQPISGAAVALTGLDNAIVLQGTTDSGGSVVFPNVPKDYGYTLRVSAAGYYPNPWLYLQVPIQSDTESFEIWFQPLGTVTDNWPPTDTFHLQLSIHTFNGEPVPSDATASIQGPSTQTVPLTINQVYPRMAQAFFMNIPIGTYTITVVARGYPTFVTTQTYPGRILYGNIDITLVRLTSIPKIQVASTTVQRGQSVAVIGSSFVPSTQATIFYSTWSGSPPVGSMAQYNVNVGTDGAFNYPLSIGNSEPLGHHDIMACNGVSGSGITISPSGSVFCALGQSNIVGISVGVPVNLQATTDASWYGIFDPIHWSVTGASPGMLVVPCLTVDGTNLVCALSSQFGVYADSNGAASGQVEPTMFPGMSTGLQSFQVKDTFSGSLSNKIPVTVSNAYTFTFTVTSIATSTATSTYLTTITSGGSTYVSTITTTNYSTSAYTQTVTNFATNTVTTANSVTSTHTLATTTSLGVIATVASTVSTAPFSWLSTVSAQGTALAGAAITFLIGLGTTGIGASMSIRRRW